MVWVAKTGLRVLTKGNQRNSRSSVGGSNHNPTTNNPAPGRFGFRYSSAPPPTDRDRLRPTATTTIPEPIFLISTFQTTLVHSFPRPFRLRPRLGRRTTELHLIPTANPTCHDARTVALPYHHTPSPSTAFSSLCYGLPALTAWTRPHLIEQLDCSSVSQAAAIRTSRPSSPCDCPFGGALPRAAIRFPFFPSACRYFPSRHLQRAPSPSPQSPLRISTSRSSAGWS